MDGAIIIPLIGLLFPILLILTALIVDAVILSWFTYRIWHDRQHWHFQSHRGVGHI